MHAFAVSRPLLLGARASPSSSCAQRPSLSQRAYVRPTSTARATLTPSEVPPPTPSMGASAPAAPSPDAPAIADVTAALSPADELRVASVRTQMEFWFSASNLRRDWYLRRQMDQDGWLDPSVFLLFNRIKNLNASLADIILACKSSDELEVSSPGAASFGDDAGQTRVRRSPDLPDFRNDDDREVARSFILRRIPQDSTVDSLLELFKPLGHVSYARIYRSTNFPDGPRALVCFPDQESADAAFLKFTSHRPPALEGILMKKRGQNQGGFNPSSPDFSVRPNMLICHFTELSLDLDWKRLYKTLTTVFTERIGDGTMRYLMYVPKADECHVTCNDNGATRALLAELTETGLVIEDSTAKVRILEDEEEVKNYWKMAAEHRASRNATRTRDSTSSSFEPIDRRPPGVIVKVDGLHEEMTWRDLKQDLSRLGKLIYLNHERGSNSCYVRFSTAEESSRVVDALSGPDAETICGTVVQSSVVAGEEETEYWNRAEELQRDRRNSRDSPPYES